MPDQCGDGSCDGYEGVLKATDVDDLLNKRAAQRQRKRLDVA